MASEPCSWRKFVKWTNILSGIGLTGLGILKFMSLFSLNLSVDTIVMPIFLVLFGVMMVAGDLEINFITENFKFLGNFFGRGLFSFYIGSTFTLVFNQSNLISWILLLGGYVLMAWGAVLITLGFMSGFGLGSDIIAETESYVAKGYKVAEQEQA